MNKRLKTALTSLILILCSGTASLAHAQMYIAGNLGIAMQRDAKATDATEPGMVVKFGFDNDIALSGAVGTRMDSLRMEAELSYQKNDLDTVGITGITVDAATLGVSGKTKALTGLVNVYYDFDTGSPFRPYITGGLGFSRADINARISFEDEQEVLDEDDTGFAFQLGAGIGYEVTENVTLDLRYRYFSIPDLKFDNIETDLSSHNITAGIRISF